MNRISFLVIGLIGWGGLTVPASIAAQSDRDENVRPNNWSVFVSGGPSTYGRFLLQRPSNATVASNEAALRGQGRSSRARGVTLIAAYVGVAAAYWLAGDRSG